MQKNIKFFICVEVRILCKEVNYVWSSHFLEDITTNMQIGNDTFAFKYPVTCKKKFKIHINFIDINVNVWLLCAHHIMSSKSFIHEDLTVNKMSVTHLVFMFQMTFIFRILRTWKARFSQHSISPNELCTNEIKVVGGQ